MNDAPETIMAWVWDLPYPSRSQGKNVWSAVMYPSDQTVTAYRRADLPATRAQIAASPEVRALVEAFEKATAQLEKVHDDAFNQAIGHGLQTTDGRPFSCMELNICDDVAKGSRAALAAFKAMEAGE